jgi:TolB protein
MNQDGSNPINLTLTSLDDYDINPSLSLDSTQIAFESNRSGDSDVWLMNADGSNPVDLTSQK